VAELREVRLPDIGDFEDVDVVELLVAPGDRVAAEDSLLVLESDKATMEIPAPFAGVVKEMRVAVGDRVSEGSLLAIVELEGAPASAEASPVAARPAPAAPPPLPRPAEAGTAAPAAAAESAGAGEEADDARLPGLVAKPPPAHASPSVRRLARELGVDLARVPPSGPKGRVRRDDVQGYVQAMLAGGTGAGVPVAGVQVSRPPEIDFARFGPTEIQPLNRVRRFAAGNLHRSWLSVPHVTQFDVADVTELEAFREGRRAEAEARGFKLTFLPFVLKACACALLEFPHMNASLDASGESLILKRYVHIGVAVDTEHGLVVPVIRDVDRKGIFALAEELARLSERARARRLRPEDLAGGSFSVSSLGGIGGTFFTPIVNHPEVAILGVSRMEWRPVHRDGAFAPRRILPLSLSYDHRVIDGADAVRFTSRLAALLADLRLLLL